MTVDPKRLHWNNDPAEPPANAAEVARAWYALVASGHERVIWRPAGLRPLRPGDDPGDAVIDRLHGTIALACRWPRGVR